MSPHAWEESTGLLSSLIPQPTEATTVTNAQTFNLSKGDLKLGPAPISEDLRAESERVLREQAMVERDPSASYDIQFPRPMSLPGLIVPSESDLLPHPTTFRTVDVEREVASVRDARKRIRLEPSVLGNIDVNSPQAIALRARALPSICAYTLHDVAEGYDIPFVTVLSTGSLHHIALPAAHFPWTHRLWQLALPRAIFDFGA